MQQLYHNEPALPRNLPASSVEYAEEVVRGRRIITRTIWLPSDCEGYAEAVVDCWEEPEA